MSDNEVWLVVVLYLKYSTSRCQLLQTAECCDFNPVPIHERSSCKGISILTKDHLPLMGICKTATLQIYKSNKR